MTQPAEKSAERKSEGIAANVFRDLGVIEVNVWPRTERKMISMTLTVTEAKDLIRRLKAALKQPL